MKKTLALCILQILVLTPALAVTRYCDWESTLDYTRASPIISGSNKSSGSMSGNAVRANRARALAREAINDYHKKIFIELAKSKNYTKLTRTVKMTGDNDYCAGSARGTFVEGKDPVWIFNRGPQ